MAKELWDVEFNSFEECSGKMLAAVDVNRLIALGVQHVAKRLKHIQRDYPIEGALDFWEMDRAVLDVFNCIIGLATCNFCGEIMIGSLQEYQFKEAAVVFLLQKGMISEERVKVPLIEDIIESLTSIEEGMFVEFYYTCTSCGDDTQSMTIGLHGHANAEAKSPKLEC